MSLILEALRKSERARQQTLSGQVSSVTPTLSHTRLPTPWVTLLGLVLVLNAVVLGFLLWRANQPPAGTPVVPAPVAAKASADTDRAGLRSLAEEAAASEPVAQPSAVAASAANKTAVPAMTTPASQTVTHASQQAVAIQQSPASVPLLSTLPEAFQQSLPRLQIEVHSYSDKPADRFVIINMQRYVAGDTLKEGPKVIAVTADGVILDYNGTRFLLPRN